MKIERKGMFKGKFSRMLNKLNLLVLDKKKEKKKKDEEGRRRKCITNHFKWKMFM